MLSGAVFALLAAVFLGLWTLQGVLRRVERLEQDATILLEELDSRIKRLTAREDYWRARATRIHEPPDQVKPDQPTETVLDLRERVRRSRGS